MNWGEKCSVQFEQSIIEYNFYKSVTFFPDKPIRWVFIELRITVFKIVVLK